MPAMDLSRSTWRKSSHSNNGGECVEVAIVWRKSSYSNNGGNCVEVAQWRKSSHSNNGGACVEVSADRVVAVRDSTDPDTAVLAFDPEGWQAFTRRIRQNTAR